MTRYEHAGVHPCSAASKSAFSAALRGIAIDADGAILAAGDAKVAIFDPDGALRSSWSTPTPAHAIAACDDGRIAVGLVGGVAFFARDGSCVERWSDSDQIRFPTSLAIRGDNVLVGDAGFRHVRRFDRGGRFLGTIGMDDRGGGFRTCNGHLDLAIDAEQTIHVADPGRHRVTRFSMQGERLGHFGRFDGVDPAGFAGCCNPTNLAITSRGEIVTVSKAPVAVKLFSSNGSLIAVLPSDEFDSQCKNCDVAVGPDDRILVVETVWREIHVYAPAALAKQTPEESR